MPTYRANVTDKDQTVLETATFEDGSAVFDDGKTRVVAKGAQTAAQRVASSGGAVPSGGSCAGVVMPHDDKPGLFMGDKIGRA